MSLDNIEEYIADSNECFNLNLVRPDPKTKKPQRILPEPFSPAFTYPIFGNEEKIIGYKNLEINLDFRATDLKPTLHIHHDGKWAGVGEIQAVPIKELLADFLPAYVINPAENEAPELPDPTSKSWKPPGKLINSYTWDDRQFEIWSASLADPFAKEVFRAMQILVPLYIEAGTELNLDDQEWTIERWTLFLLYEVTPLKNSPDVCPYTIAGFSTSYRLWVFPTKEILRATKSIPSPPASENGDEAFKPPRPEMDPETHRFKQTLNPLEEPSRERISQFLILPPFQGQSHGSRLYQAMFNSFVKLPNIFQITVEDPNESFDDMRDYCDIAYLRTFPAFNNLSIPDSIPSEALRKDTNIPIDLIRGSETTIATLRRDTKITPRQFDRMVELHLLSTIPALHRTTNRITRKEKSADANDRKYYFWRLLLKDRLFLHNIDQLMQIEPEERIEKIDAAALSVQSDYERLLEGVTKRSGLTAEASSSTKDGVESAPRKLANRRRVVIESDEEMDDAPEKASGSMVPRKRAAEEDTHGSAGRKKSKAPKAP